MVAIRRTLMPALAALTLPLLAPLAPASAVPTVSPGSMLRITVGEYGCTVGITGTDRTGQPFAVTAGHCASKVGDLAYPGLSLDPIGTVRAVSKLFDLDYALIRVNGTVPETIVAAPPKVGQRVCKTGRMTGVTCGPITAVTAKDIVVRVKAFPGDSGGPLQDQAGRVIGITSRANLPLSTPPIAAIGHWGLQLASPKEVRFVRADRIAARIGYTPAAR